VLFFSVAQRFAGDFVERGRTAVTIQRTHKQGHVGEREITLMRRFARISNARTT